MKIKKILLGVVIGSGESTGYELKNRLKNANYSQYTQIEELFNAYGY